MLNGSRSVRDISDFLSRLEEWATRESDIVGIALVGSYARGEAKASSDLDLVILTTSLESRIQERGWVEAFGKVMNLEVINYGMVTSLHVRYEEGREVEFGITTPEWGKDPADEETQEVIRHGLYVVFDRLGGLRQIIPQISS